MKRLAAACAGAAVCFATAALALDRNDVAGTWEYYDPAAGETYRFVLNADGTGTVDDEPVTYTVRGNTVRVKTPDDVLEYTVALKGDVLTVSGGDLDEPTPFKRKGKGAAKRRLVPVPVRVDEPADGAAPDEPVAPEAEEAEKPAKPQAAKPAVKKRSDQGLVGTWKSDEGLVTFKDDGSVSYLGHPAKYKLDGNQIVLTGEKGSVNIEYAVDGDTLTLRGSGQVATLRRRDEAEAAAMEGSPAVGVWVAEEATLDPSNYLRFTQYLAILPDGTVHWDKSEGGATKRQVSDYLARTVIHSQGRSGFQNHGRWEDDGNGGIVIRWTKWNGLVSRGRINGDALRLEKMGVLEEGATLSFQKQEQK